MAYEDGTTLGEFHHLMKGELQHQADCWGDGSFESLDATDIRENSPMEFVGYIAKYSTRWFSGGFKPWSVDVLKAFQISMVKVATLAYSGHRMAGFKIAEIEGSKNAEGSVNTLDQ